MIRLLRTEHLHKLTAGHRTHGFPEGRLRAVFHNHQTALSGSVPDQRLAAIPRRTPIEIGRSAQDVALCRCSIERLGTRRRPGIC